jgi:hypothetical protein
LTSQQPAGHELDVQLQLPPLHSWPARQAGPSPHKQPPSLPQPFAPEPQSTHFEAETPQAAAVVGVRHVWSV